MRTIDELHIDFPFAGARCYAAPLRANLPGVGRRRIGSLMRHMGVAAVCPEPGGSRRHRGHPVCPYLLRHRTITRPK